MPCSWIPIYAMLLDFNLCYAVGFHYIPCCWMSISQSKDLRQNCGITSSQLKSYALCDPAVRRKVSMKSSFLPIFIVKVGPMAPPSPTHHFCAWHSADGLLHALNFRSNDNSSCHYFRALVRRRHVLKKISWERMNSFLIMWYTWVLLVIL